jgi:hypothetical protein
MPSALTSIAWQSLASTTTTVTFSSIAGSYRDLRLIMQAPSGVNTQFTFRLNGDTAVNTNYPQITMYGNGSTTNSLNGNNAGPYQTALSSTTATSFIFEFLDYSTTNKHKLVLLRSNNANASVEAQAIRWTNTAAVTSISIVTPTAMPIGTTFALYGIAA